MKILWISGSRIVGGAERVTFQVLGELRRRGHDVAALYRPGAQFESELRQTAFEPYPASLGGSLNLRAVFAIRRALSALRPDVALVTTSDEWVWASLVPRFAPSRLVLVRHMALALPANVRWLANRRADAVIAVSEAARINLMRKPGIDPAKLCVIANPVRIAIRPEAPSAEDRRKCRIALGLRPQARWIGFFGGTEPHKGLRDMMLAVRRLQDGPSACNLLVAGREAKDPAAPSVAQIAREYGLTDAVRGFGMIDDMEDALTACDAVAIATHSSLGEAAPLAALEAMACGTPVAAYAVGGIPEMLGGECPAGALARPDDPEDLARQLGRLLSDTEFAKTLTAAALARVRAHYTCALAADRYEEVFNRLCGRPRVLPEG
jgi:glycosyltransferase involved in cell wall biosynthesis